MTLVRELSDPAMEIVERLADAVPGLLLLRYADVRLPGQIEARLGREPGNPRCHVLHYRADAEEGAPGSASRVVGEVSDLLVLVRRRFCCWFLTIRRVVRCLRGLPRGSGSSSMRSGRHWGRLMRACCYALIPCRSHMRRPMPGTCFRGARRSLLFLREVSEAETGAG